MPIQRKVELNTIEFPDALEFTVSREEGMAERVVFPIFALIVFVWFWSIGSLWPRIIAAFRRPFIRGLADRQPSPGWQEHPTRYCRRSRRRRQPRPALLHSRRGWRRRAFLNPLFPRRRRRNLWPRSTTLLALRRAIATHLDRSSQRYYGNDQSQIFLDADRALFSALALRRSSTLRSRRSDHQIRAFGVRREHIRPHGSEQLILNSRRT